jgi:hypothetical protein
MAMGEDFYDARWAVENQMQLDLKHPSPSLTWFGKSRTRLIDRVPEAENHLYRRRRQTQRQMSDRLPSVAIQPQSSDLGL